MYPSNSLHWWTSMAVLLCFATVCENYEKNCLKCEDFNRHNTKKCVEIVSECGECLPGNIPGEGDDNFCYPLEILENPHKSVAQVKGLSIQLSCVFNSKVQCVWERNGQHVDIDGSRRYKFKGQGVNEVSPNEDCSLVINDLSPIDAGQWQCGSKATSSTISVKSSITTVTIVKEQMLVVQPKTVTKAAFNVPVTLECVFDQPVKCSWNLKDKHKSWFDSVPIVGNYEWVDVGDGLKADCSIRVKGLREEDEGWWVCAGRNPHTEIVIESQEALLTGTSEDLIDIYMNNEIVNERDIQMKSNTKLECKTDHEFRELRWEIGGKSIKNIANSQSITLIGEDLERHLSGVKWTSATVSCLAAAGNEININKSIICHKEHLMSLMSTGNEAGCVSPYWNILSFALLICGLIYWRH